MRKSRLIILGLILALLIMMVSLAGCFATTSATTTGSGSSTSGSLSYLWMIGFIVVIFGLMYFFTIRPQRKRQKEMQQMMESMQRGDKVITNAGIYGTIETVYEDSFLIRIESGATIKIAKWAVVGKQPEQTVKTG